MSQHLGHHHQQPQYVHYTGPPGTQLHTQPVQTSTQAVAVQQQSQHPASPAQPQVSTAQSQQPTIQQSGPLIATGDWTKDLVQLAKQAELKKHALTLQLHTAHILSAHASMEQKRKAVEDIKEQKNKLDSERSRLLQCLSQVNEDRDKADLLQTSIEKEYRELETKITTLTEGEYAVAKRDVDRLRQELGHPPVQTLQNALDEKASQYLNERRLNGNESQNSSASASASVSAKRNATEASLPPDGHSNGKRPRGRPKGSKNRAKNSNSNGPSGSGAGTPVAGAPGSSM
ncbi:hypothetical protein BDN72DRAFT_792029 [Pluteus cervinus]|uniref:Uncharacterized protein n=1 Tax=Pluteus cervinus TaxID=181527 RepID=A0ACD3B4B6_9AGAR|nr:hypothetical protein BDN72DRAFT_792029 [Pluteus cervinus]